MHEDAEEWLVSMRMSPGKVKVLTVPSFGHWHAWSLQRAPSELWNIFFFCIFLIGGVVTGGFLNMSLSEYAATPGAYLPALARLSLASLILDAYGSILWRVSK